MCIRAINRIEFALRRHHGTTFSEAHLSDPAIPAAFGRVLSGIKRNLEDPAVDKRRPCLELVYARVGNTFGTDNICLFNNGTLALQIALQGMGISGEVIMTPYTFVATTLALYFGLYFLVFN